MIAAIDWSGLDVAGAFVVGVAAGCILTIRLMRVAANVVRRERDE